MLFLPINFVVNSYPTLLIGSLHIEFVDTTFYNMYRISSHKIYRKFLYIFANQINENLADVMVPCVHHKICYGYQIGTYGLGGQCGNGRCIKLNEDGSGYILTVNSKYLKIIVFMLKVS